MAWVNIEDNRKWHREWEKKKYHEDPEYREKIKKQQRDRVAADSEYRERNKICAKKWHAENRERALANQRAWYEKCKAETPWILCHRGIKRRCIDPKNKNYKYYGGKGIKALLTREEIKFLWKRDNAWQLRFPTIDRIDSDGDYSFENCRFIEQFENSSRAHKGKFKGDDGKMVFIK